MHPQEERGHRDGSPFLLLLSHFDLHKPANQASQGSTNVDGEEITGSQLRGSSGGGEGRDGGGISSCPTAYRGCGGCHGHSSSAINGNGLGRDWNLLQCNRLDRVGNDSAEEAHCLDLESHWSHKDIFINGGCSNGHFQNHSAKERVVNFQCRGHAGTGKR